MTRLEKNPINFQSTVLSNDVYFLSQVNILETYLKANTTKHPSSTSLPYENDSDFVFPNIVPQSTLSATLHKYNISLQNEKRELLNLENVILKMQNIVEAALLEIYKLEDSLTDDTVPHYTAALQIINNKSITISKSIIFTQKILNTRILVPTYYFIFLL